MPTYLITWSTYGTWLHGDGRESVTEARNTPGTPRVAPSERLQDYSRSVMREAPFVLSGEHRSLVGEAIRAQCKHREWTLHALNVRTNHVHVVCSATPPPERVMGEFKAWASRRLHESGVGTSYIWTRHGSTRWIDTVAAFQRAVHYVLHEQ